MAINNNSKPHSLTHIWNMGFDQVNQKPWIQNIRYVPRGSSSDDFEREIAETLDLRVDDTSETNAIYIGDAPRGSATSDPYWRIKKIDETNGLVISWADDNSEFDNVWDNRTTYFD